MDTASAPVQDNPDAMEPKPDAGWVHLQNNPDRSDVASDQIQGTMPDTDPMQLPIDPDTNLPD